MLTPLPGTPRRISDLSGSNRHANYGPSGGQRAGARSMFLQSWNFGPVGTFLQASPAGMEDPAVGVSKGAQSLTQGGRSTQLGDVTQPGHALAATTFSIKKCDHLAEGVDVGRIAEERSLAVGADQPFMLQLLQVVGQGGRGNAERGLELAGEHPVRMGGQQQPQDAEPRLRAERGEDVGVAGNRIVLDRAIHRGCLVGGAGLEPAASCL